MNRVAACGSSHGKVAAAFEPMLRCKADDPGRTVVAPEASGLGTLVVLNDEIHAARFVQKSHTALPSAFTSPLTGALGLVAEGRPRMHWRRSKRPCPIPCGSGADAPVALVHMSPGDDGRMLRHIQHLGYRGLVLEGMGAGHVPAIVAPIISELVAAFCIGEIPGFHFGEPALSMNAGIVPEYQSVRGSTACSPAGTACRGRQPHARAVSATLCANIADLPRPEKIR